MQFDFNDDDFVWNVNILDNETPYSRFDNVFKNQWLTAVESGVCRYRLTNLLTKILPGKFGFVAQVSSTIPSIFYTHN